jgi:hypothetical protein
MKETIILLPDKETSERLTTLINLLFPDVRASCASDGLDDPEKFRIDPPPGKAATSGPRSQDRRGSKTSARPTVSVKR